MTRYFSLVLEAGRALDDDGEPTAWATCPDLPGAYEEAPTPDEARDRLRALARHIIAEHLLREDPLDPAVIAHVAPAEDGADRLAVAITDDDLAAIRAMPLLAIEQPEP